MRLLRVFLVLECLHVCISQTLVHGSGTYSVSLRPVGLRLMIPAPVFLLLAHAYKHEAKCLSVFFSLPRLFSLELRKQPGKQSKREFSAHMLLCSSPSAVYRAAARDWQGKAKKPSRIHGWFDCMAQPHACRWDIRHTMHINSSISKSTSMRK